MSSIKRIQKELKGFPQLKPVVFYDYPYRGGRHEAILLPSDELPQKVSDLVGGFISLPLSSGEGVLYVSPCS